MQLSFDIFQWGALELRLKKKYLILILLQQLTDCTLRKSLVNIRTNKMVFVDTVQPLCRQSLKPHVPLSWRKLGTPASGSPKGSAGGLQVTEMWQSDRRLWGSNTIGHSGTPWPVRSSFLYKSCPPSPHPLSIQLFKTSRRLSSLFWFLSPRGAQAQLTLPTPTNSREESCSFQLSSPRKPPCNSSSTNLEQRRDVLQENFKPTTELQSPTEPRRPHYRQRRFHRTTNGAANSFAPFHGR